MKNAPKQMQYRFAVIYETLSIMYDFYEVERSSLRVLFVCFQLCILVGLPSYRCFMDILSLFFCARPAKKNGRVPKIESSQNTIIGLNLDIYLYLFNMITHIT